MQIHSWCYLTGSDCPNARQRRRERRLVAPTFRMVRKIGGETFGGLYHFATLREALDVVKDRQEVDVSEREACAREITGPGNCLVKHIDLLLHRRQRADDRGAVGPTVGSLRN